MISPLPKAVIFDWDNTIINSHQVMLYAMNETRKVLGKKQQDTFSYGPRLDNLKSEFGEEWQVADKLYKSYLNENAIGKISLNEGILPLLKHLKNSDIYAAIVSNKIGELLRKEVSYFGLNQYFSKVVGSGDTEQDKPSPIPLFFALTESKIPPTIDVCYVGDGVIDIECAKSAGVRPIIYNNPELENYYTDVLKVKSFYQLLQYLST